MLGGRVLGGQAQGFRRCGLVQCMYHVLVQRLHCVLKGTCGSSSSNSNRRLANARWKGAGWIGAGVQALWIGTMHVPRTGTAPERCSQRRLQQQQHRINAVRAAALDEHSGCSRLHHVLVERLHRVLKGTCGCSSSTRVEVQSELLLKSLSCSKCTGTAPAPCFQRHLQRQRQQHTEDAVRAAAPTSSGCSKC
jgi:hypothetical protein